MPNSTSPGRRCRRMLAASVSAAMLVTPQAHAFERIVMGIDRFVYCAGLMLSDPKTHAENCLPSRAMSPPDSLSGGNSDPGPAILVVAPPPPPPPPLVVVAPPPPPPVVVDPVDCGPTDCGPTDCGPTDCGPTDCGPADA